MTATLTLPHHHEFLSDSWLDEAREFLIREVGRRGLQGHSFSRSVRCTDAPPHLGFADDVATWTLRVGGGEVRIDRGFDPAATQVVEGDYQAALTHAQQIGALLPRYMESCQREVNQLFGPLALRSTGQIQPEGVRELLASLHDHMGRRTVENPDLEHRARRLGLAHKVREMEEQGFTILERAITPEFADEVREATLAALLPHHGVQLQWMLYHGRPFERLVQNPKLMTLIDVSLGRGAVIASLSAIRKGTGPGFIPLHTDYSMIPEPYPEFAMTGVGVWALEDWRVSSGPTWIVPRSHLLRRGPKPGENAEGGIPVEMPKGSVVFFTHGVWHWQGDRSDPGERVTLHAHFNRGILRGLEPKKIDVQMLHRNAPRLGEMLGEDDWFDKLTAEGRDHTRAVYMARLHQFSERAKARLLAAAD